MRRLMIVAVLVILLASGYRSLGSESTGTGSLTLSEPWPTPGAEVPSFEATRLNGQTFDMPDKGTYVVSFWSTLNKGSRVARPAFEDMAHDYGGSKVSFAAVYVGGVPRDDRQGAPYAVIKDASGRLTSLYNVKRVPRLFLIKNGKVRLTEESFYKDDQQAMRRKLDSMLRSGA